MKKLALLALGLGALSCTNAKLENKPTRNAPEYKSLEKEAEQWLENQQ